MKKTLRFLGKMILALLIFVIGYVLLALAIPYISVNTKDADPKEDVSVYIRTNGVHTDLVVPIKTEFKNWSETIQFNHIKSKDSSMQFIGFGWGDKGFYLDTPEWSDLKFSTAFVAAFGLGSSAMHATFYKEINESKDCVKLTISSKEYKKLITYIEKKFKYDKKGKPILIDAATYGQNDSFYEANGSYSFFYTCNTWANNGLKAMDQKAALWSASDFGISQHYK